MLLDLSNNIHSSLKLNDTSFPGTTGMLADIGSVNKYNSHCMFYIQWHQDYSTYQLRRCHTYSRLLLS